MAQFLAAHAVAWLLLASLLLVVVAWTAWSGVERYAPRLLTTLAPHWARLDRGRLAARYLGWHAATAFLIVGVAVPVFVEIADAVVEDESVVAFDRALAGALGRELGTRTLQVFAVLTHLGDPPVLTGIVIAGALLLVASRRLMLAISFVIATAAGGLLNDGLKAWFERVRPVRLHDFAPVTGYSFPSGHAAGSMLVYGLGAYVLARLAPHRWRLPIAALALVLVICVGASRVLLQVHYASDVVAGWLVAGSWAALCVAGYEAVRLSGLRRSQR